MTALRHLRLIGTIEGWSYLALLGVAMPLKYLFDLPLAVRWVGLAHGLLFVLFVLALTRAATVRVWPWQRSAAAFVASLIPGGTFWLSRSLTREMGETTQ